MKEDFLNFCWDLALDGILNSITDHLTGFSLDLLSIYILLEDYRILRETKILVNNLKLRLSSLKDGHTVFYCSSWWAFI